MFGFISFPIFLVTFSIGLLFVYLSQPETTVIYVYPTPDNVINVEYKDKADSCFQFESLEVKCPSNKNDINKIPLQN